MNRYDVIIIGGGLGGLECGAILAKEGMNVCVVEKNPAVGGCLQSFTRRGRLIDTGMHYIGSMDDGQLLNLYFKYFGILDKLRLRRLESDGFDVIALGDRQYRLAAGYDGFIEGLAAEFPAERENLRRYCSLIEEVGSTIGPEVLRRGHISLGSLNYFDRPASRVCEELIGDPVLREVLAGNSLLYDGVRGATPLYHYGTINYSFVSGPYRFAGGSQQLADALADSIRASGGTVLTGCRAVSAEVCGERNIRALHLDNGERLEAEHYISSLHPAATFGLLDALRFGKKTWFSRIMSLKNTRGTFSAYLVMKKGRMRYDNRNYYFHSSEQAWNPAWTDGTEPPPSVMMSMQAPPQGEYAEVVNLLVSIDGEMFAPWAGTQIHRRGDDYEEMKSRLAERMIDFTESRYPGLKGAIEAVYTSSPLTYADYTATPGGSAYGIMKDCNMPFGNIVPVRTKFPNLLLTGQSLNVHGALGVTVTAAITCAELLGTEYLAKKIGNA